MRSKLIKLLTGAATATLLFLGPLIGLVATPAGASGSYTAFVSNTSTVSNSVSEVTGTGSSWSAGTPLVVGDGSCCITNAVVSPDGSTLYQAIGYNNTIVPISTSTLTAGTPFSDGLSSTAIDAITPNGADLLVTGGGNQLAVISTSNTSDIQTVTVGNGPFGIAILPDSSAAYITNETDGTVSVVSLTGVPSVTDTISFPGSGCDNPFYDVVTPNGKKVYVACEGNAKIWKIKVATNHPAGTGINIPGGSDLWQIAITPNGHTIYAAIGSDVYPVTLSTKTVGTGIAVGAGVWSVAVSPNGSYVLAGINESESGGVTVIKTSTNHVTDTVATGDGDFSIEFES